MMGSRAVAVVLEDLDLEEHAVSLNDMKGWVE
jgi:hypothetical protein